jgi:protein CWC15
MTTAHRPTWAPAKGHEEQGGARMFGPSHKHSKLDDNAHMTLKTRTDGQQSIKELMARDFKAELEEKERKHFKKKLGGGDGGDGELMLGDGGIESAAARFAPKAIDADDSDDSDASGSDSDDDDDDDDTAALLAELDRIKTERAEEAARKEAEREEAEALERAEEVAGGNPLLNLKGAADFTVKRRWDDDVVFKNQTRGEPKSQKRFINDTIRSDFHKRFLNKYIK